MVNEDEDLATLLEQQILRDKIEKNELVDMFGDAVYRPLIIKVLKAIDAQSTFLATSFTAAATHGDIKQTAFIFGINMLFSGVLRGAEKLNISPWMNPDLDFKDKLIDKAPDQATIDNHKSKYKFFSGISIGAFAIIESTILYLTFKMPPESVPAVVASSLPAHARAFSAMHRFFNLVTDKWAICDKPQAIPKMAEEKLEDLPDLIPDTT